MGTGHESDVPLMESTNPLRVIWGYRWWLLLFAFSVAIVIYLLSSQAAEQYSATAVAQVESGREASNEFVSADELFQKTNFFAELARTAPVRELAAQNLNPDAEDPELDTNVSVAPRSDLQLLEFTAVSGDPERAATVANAYMNAFAEFIENRQVEERQETLDRIQTRVDELNQILAV